MMSSLAYLQICPTPGELRCVNVRQTARRSGSAAGQAAASPPTHAGEHALACTRWTDADRAVNRESTALLRQAPGEGSRRRCGNGAESHQDRSASDALRRAPAAEAEGFSVGGIRQAEA